MTISKRGFGTNRELAKEMGRINGAKSKGRKLTPEHIAKLREAARRNIEKRKLERLETKL